MDMALSVSNPLNPDKPWAIFGLKFQTFGQILGRFWVLKSAKSRQPSMGTSRVLLRHDDDRRNP